jgi:hypothetical protein
MKPSRLLQPRAVPGPRAVAPRWMKTPYLLRALATLNPVVIFTTAHIFGAQVVCWALLVAAWVVARVLCAVWNWVLLPILACARFRFHAWRARRRGDTVAGAVALALPAPARTARAIQAAAPVAYPALPMGPRPDTRMGVEVIQPDGSIAWQEWEVPA